MKIPFHGSPADRGAADAYYKRPASPHKYVRDNLDDARPELKITQLSKKETDEYNRAYTKEADEQAYSFKEW
jgi:hypothetical protein